MRGLLVNNINFRLKEVNIMQWQKVHQWMEKNLQEPFVRAELARAEVRSGEFLGLKGATLLGSISVLTVTVLILVFVH